MFNMYICSACIYVQHVYMLNMYISWSYLSLSLSLYIYIYILYICTYCVCVYIYMGTSILLREGNYEHRAAGIGALSICCRRRSGPGLPPCDFFWSSISCASCLPKSAHLVSAPALKNMWQDILLRFIRPFRAASSKLPFLFVVPPQRNASKKWHSKSVKAQRPA